MARVTLTLDGYEEYLDELLKAGKDIDRIAEQSGGAVVGLG